MAAAEKGTYRVMLVYRILARGWLSDHTDLECSSCNILWGGEKGIVYIQGLKFFVRCEKQQEHAVVRPDVLDPVHGVSGEEDDLAGRDVVRGDHAVVCADDSNPGSALEQNRNLTILMNVLSFNQCGKWVIQITWRLLGENRSWHAL